MIEASHWARPAVVVLTLLIGGCTGGQAAPGDNPTAVPAPSPTPEGTVVIETDGGPVEVRVEIADTPEEQTLGLMGRTELASDAGMVFLVEDPVSTSFYMKDTLIPLSIAFWDEDGRIHTILDMEPCRSDPCPSYFPRRPWSGALEVNQGFFADQGVEVGDRAGVRS